MATKSRANLRVVRPGRRILGYARVSSQEQAIGSSLDDQQEAMRRHAATLGLEVTKFFVEAESAVHEKIERREQMRALLAEVREGDLVVCDKLDRWSRDPEFTYRSIRELTETGASFYAVGDRCDPSTRDGDLMLSVRVMVAREEHKRIRERTVGTRKILRDKGYYVEGLPPFGYRRSLGKGEKGIEKNVLVAQEAEAAKVREAFRLCIQGRSLSQIGKVIGLTKDKVGIMLRARIYRGEIEDSRGEWIKGMHPAIIDADVFARAQNALDERKLGGARPHDAPSETRGWILRDVARCALCGARMGAAYAGPPDGRRYYYRCVKKCTNEYVRVEPIEAEAEKAIVERLEQLRVELAREPKTKPAPVVVNLDERRANLQKKRERYLEQNADGHITREQLREAMAKLDVETMKLDGEEAASKKTSPLADAAARRSMLKNVADLRRAWTSAEPEARRAIVSQLATAALMAKGRPIAMTWRAAEEMA